MSAETTYRPGPGDRIENVALTHEEEVLFCLDDFLDIERREGRSDVIVVAALARFEGANRALQCDWLARLSPESIKRATTWFLVQWDAVLAKHRMIGPLLPTHKSVEVFPWVACAICGRRPEDCNPLPKDWAWDTTEATNNWVWCPEHRL